MNPFRYLALGDSYTIGEAVPEAERFPVQLVRRLREQKIAIADPEIIARTGWTTDELMEAIARRPPAGPFDLVTLLIGVNNQYRGRDLQEYRAQFVALLERAIEYAGGNAERVIVLSIPDWGMTQFGRMDRRVSREIDEFNAVNRAESEQAGARYVDITPLTRRVPEDRELTAGDGLHPSGKLYAQWVTLLEPVARTVLSIPHV